MNPYITVDGYTVVYNHWTIKIITKDKIDVWDWTIILPKQIIQFVLDNQLPSPLPITVLSLTEEVWWLIDAICYSPDENTGFFALKNLYYINK